MVKVVLVMALAFGSGVLANLTMVKANAQVETACLFPHPRVQMRQPDGAIRRAGVGVGTVGSGAGLWVGSGTEDCSRITAINAYWDNNNTLELGAVKEPTNHLVIPCGPSTQSWYRFWTRINLGALSCNAPGTYLLLGSNNYYTLNIHRNPDATTSWLFQWNGSHWVTLSFSKTAGVPLMGMERGHANDSGYSKYSGAVYQVAAGGWLGWDGVMAWCDFDRVYDLYDPAPQGSGVDSFEVQKPSDNYSTECVVYP